LNFKFLFILPFKGLFILPFKVLFIYVSIFALLFHTRFFVNCFIW
jgi:hypothetical protein